MVPLFIAVAMMLALLAIWTQRETIVGNIIEDQLAQYDIPGTYEIERIGGRRQVLTNVVLGDPEAPDFTAERVEIHLRHRFGTPEIERIVLVEPRLYGRYGEDGLTFGSLDPLIFAESDEPPGLPDIDLAIRDGRGVIDSAYGPVGIKIEGEGNVANGFAGIAAINAPELAFDGCSARRATLYGDVTTSSGEPRFEGPARLASLRCDGLALDAFGAQLTLEADADLAGFDARASVRTSTVVAGEYAANGIDGTVRASLRDDVLAARHSLALRGARSPQALAALLTFDGTLRGGSDLADVTWRGDVEGNGLRLGPSLSGSLASLAQVGEGTLAEPIARRIAASLEREARGSEFSAALTLRKRGDALSMVMPSAAMRGGSGTQILSLSQVEYSSDGDGLPRLAGNLQMGGAGLPRVTGRMERGSGPDTVFRLSMAPYEAGGSSLAIPSLTLAQGTSGAIGFAGEAAASGPLPGGSARNLRVPLNGRWVPGGTLALWRDCTTIGFDRLEVASLALDQQSLTLCPSSSGAIVQSGPGGLQIAAGVPALDLTGSLADTPIRIASGPVGFAWPGVMNARELDIVLGPQGSASRFTVSNLDARFGDDIAGTFSDADIVIDALPLDLRNARGDWRYAEGRVVLEDGAFRLLDREEPDRFEPLEARGARLTLEDNIIRAFATLRHPASDRAVTDVSIVHNLSTSAGHADLAIGGVRFDGQLQPDDLSVLAKGVVANVEGVVTGTGRIDWNGDTLTSTGSFTTDNLDFAAAFGPVRGASGTIEFTDLLGLTTAPGQKLRIASVNPGIEVADGEIEFAIREGTLVSVAGGSWPFMGGRLILREVDLNFGVEEERAYVFEIVGLDAGVFVEQMELGNLSATGLFDGTVPIVFDEAGNGRIEQGILISRPPGGNISYVGELTYEDLSAIANFAFDALRSLDYSQMQLIMEGPLTGEIITRVRFDGVRQGEGAKSNIVTRQLARLPIRFRINIRAEFYKLITSVKSMYDPAAVRDPRELGLLSDDGVRLREVITGEEAEPRIDPDDIIPDEPPIQQQESEKRP